MPVSSRKVITRNCALCTVTSEVEAELVVGGLSLQARVGHDAAARAVVEAVVT